VATAYPSGFHPYRNSHSKYDGMGGLRVTTRTSSRLSRLARRYFQPPQAAIEPRIPGIPVYSVGRDELAKGDAGNLQIGAGKPPMRSRPHGRRSLTRSDADGQSSYTGKSGM